MKGLAIAGLTVLTTWFSGCAMPSQPAPPKVSYLLNAQPDAPPPAAALPVCLRVRSVTVHSPFSGSNLIYRTGEVTYEKDYYNVFLNPPDQQIQEALGDWLRAADVTLCADGLSGGTEIRLTLEPHLEALYADFRTPDAPTVYAKLRYVLTRYDPSCRCGQILIDQIFDASVALEPKPTAETVVEAMSQAIKASLGQFIVALSREFP